MPVKTITKEKLRKICDSYFGMLSGVNLSDAGNLYDTFCYYSPNGVSLIEVHVASYPNTGWRVLDVEHALNKSAFLDHLENATR